MWMRRRMRTVVSSLFYSVLVVIVPFPRVLAFLGAEVELRAARVPSPTSYPAGQRPRHDPLFGSEELRGERRHSTLSALLGSPRLITATAPSAPPDQFRPAVLARSVDPHAPVLRRPVSLPLCRSWHRSVRPASAPSPAGRRRPGGIARARPGASAPEQRSGPCAGGPESRPGDRGTSARARSRAGSAAIARRVQRASRAAACCRPC